MAIRFQADLTGITPTHLQGFFVGWLNVPTPETFYRMLAESSHVSLALDEDTGRVVAFAQAISDGILTAFIPLLEVLPEYQGHGLGREVMERLLTQLQDFYAVDLSCDEPLIPFYGQLGFTPGTAMAKRDYPAPINTAKSEPLS